MNRNVAVRSAAALAVAALCACGSSARTGGSQSPTVSPVCTSLHAADINAATGLGVGPGAATPDRHGCTYVDAADGASVTVIVNAGGAGQYESLRSTQGAHQVSGVGDKAFAVASGGGVVMVDLYAVRGSDLLAVIVGTPQSVADVVPATQDAEKVARVALQRI